MNKISHASSAVALPSTKGGLSTRSLHSRISRMRKKSLRRRWLHYGLLAGNLVLLSVVGFFIARTSSTSGDTVGTAMTTTVSGVANAAAADSSKTVNPLDQLSSADIAVNIARAANLPEALPITSQAISEDVELSAPQASDGLVTKTQVVVTSLKSNKDIRDHVVQGGETAASIAAKAGVTTDSVLWSNNLASDMVSPGQTLAIPPMNGIVYTVKAGDTAESLAQKYQTSAEKIIVTNDAELTGLRVGTRILIPDGRVQSTAAAAPRSRGYGSSTFPWGGGPVYGGANGYDFGYCTWYVANRISVPSNWGNANTWDNLAPRSGWVVSTAPRVGAIAQTDRGGYGHVAVVTAVSEDGTQIKYADMNGVAGWGREGFSGWTTVSRYEHYIYR